MDKKRFYFKLDRNKIKLQLRELGEQLRNRRGVLRNVSLVLLFLLLAAGGFFFYRYEQEGKGEDLINYGYNQENPLIQFNYGEEGDYTNRSQATPGDFTLNYPALGEIININEEDIAEPENSPAEEEVVGVVTESLRPVSRIEEERGMELIKPVSGKVVQTSGWYYNPVLEDWRYQEGIAFSGNAGDIVMAAAAGRVLSVEEDVYRGIMVVIEHDNGWVTEYGHLERATVSPGARVSKGQEIGRVGDSGMTTEPVLYFSLRNNEGAIDPLSYFNR